MTECVNCAKFKGCDLSSPNVNECADYKEILTNEEWFDGLSTEEKADWLSKHLRCGDCDIENRECFGTYSGCKETLIKWLKEIHT